MITMLEEEEARETFLLIILRRSQVENVFFIHIIVVSCGKLRQWCKVYDWLALFQLFTYC